MTILCLMTGGTIGSVVNDGTIDVSQSDSNDVIARYNESKHSPVEFEVKKPYWILSENVSLREWNILIKEIRTIDYTKYEGIIISHGSDTLSYTSAVLGELFDDYPIPIMITASNYPLDDERSNGLSNFTTCVETIKNRIEPGVYAVYQNVKGRHFVYEATDINEADPFVDDFTSFCCMPYAELVEHKLVINRSRHHVEKNTGKVDELVRDVAVFRPYPGMRFDHICFSENPAAVLIYLYHSGTASTEGVGSVLEFINKCIEEKICVYLASYKDTKAAKYATANKLLLTGAASMENVSLPAAYAKILINHNA